jgi:hypothetical protein
VIASFTHSEPGGHRENQDAFEVRPLPGTTDGYLCAVADGQGGRAGGALAAALACKACLDAASGCPVADLLGPAAWIPILRAADEAVAACKEAGATTLVAFCLTENALCGGSGGDSAAVVVNPRQPPAILTRGQQKNPPVGSGAAVFVPFSTGLLPPWTVLAMTDGVWKYAGWEQVFAAAAACSGTAMIGALRKAASLPASGRLQDDFTLVGFQG